MQTPGDIQLNAPYASARPVRATMPTVTADAAAAPGAIPVRKVRTAQGTVLGNAKAEKSTQADESDGKCNRKIPLKRMQNDECRMQNEKTKCHSGCLILLFCILHSSFCILFSKGEMVR
jgi:hypothetical protein